MVEGEEKIRGEEKRGMRNRRRRRGREERMEKRRTRRRGKTQRALSVCSQPASRASQPAKEVNSDFLSPADSVR